MAKTRKSVQGNKKRAMRGGSGITIDDIAAAAEVSTATVSRFFNERGKLRAATAQRIQAAVSRTGYVPSAIASELASKKSKLVAAVVPMIAPSIFSSTIQALSDELANKGYSVMLALTGERDEHLIRQLRSIVGRRPDGIILTSSTIDAEAREMLLNARVPIIETWDLPKNPIDLVVGLSHAAVGRALARYALKTSRRRTFIVTASGPRAQARSTSLVRMLRANGAPEPTIAQLPGLSTYGQGRAAVANHLEAGGKPDLIVCSSDLSAHGVLDELQRRGVHVPDDIAVIGFADLDFAAHLRPALTTVKIDGARIGQQAVQFLLQRAEGTKIEAPVIDIGFSIVVRESS